MRPVSIVALVLVLGVPVSCKSRPDGQGASFDVDAARPDPIAPLRARVKTKLAAIAAIAPNAQAAPPVKQGGKPLSLASGAYFVTAPDYLADPHATVKNDDGRPRFDGSVYSLCAYATSGTVPPASEDQKYLEQCDAWTHVAVARTQAWTVPTIDLDSKRFSPGMYVGDLLVYAIDSGQLVGSFVVTGTNNKELEFDVKKGESSADKKRDFVNNATADISANVEATQKKLLEGK
jgi:hypothetical protein